MNGANDENKAPSDLQDSSIEQTLLVSSSVASLRPEVIEYFCTNAKDLLKIALKPEVSTVVNYAFSIAYGSSKIQQNILEKSELEKIADEILRPGVSNLQVSKFCKIIQSLFKRFPKKASESCPFILKFIEFADFGAVVTLFSELLKAKDEEVVIFDYLVEIQLPRIVAEAIVNVKDINSELAAGLYKLVTVFSNYPIMQKLYQNDNTVNLLYLEKTPTSRLVLANQWDSILHVMNNETLLFFLPLVEIAMKNVLSINGEIWQHHAICFRFLSKISALEEAQPLMKGISKAVTNVIMSFPNHSIALGSAVDLAIQLASIPDFDISEMMNILPVAALMVKERRSVIVASWCFKLIRDVRQLTPAMTKLVDSLEPDVLNIIKTTSAIIETPYGGSIPKPEDSFGGLTSEQEALIMNDVTPEQILNIRKYFIRKL